MSKANREYLVPDAASAFNDTFPINSKKKSRSRKHAQFHTACKKTYNRDKDLFIARSLSTKSSAGRKDDAGKPQWDLLPMAEVEDVVKVLTYGAKKYPEPDNWKRVPSARNRYYSAALRHIVAWKCGERLAPDSKLPHLAHAVCCLLFLAWFDSPAAITERMSMLYHATLPFKIEVMGHEKVKGK